MVAVDKTSFDQSTIISVGWDSERWIVHHVAQQKRTATVCREYTVFFRLLWSPTRCTSPESARKQVIISERGGTRDAVSATAARLAYNLRRILWRWAASRGASRSKLHCSYDSLALPLCRPILASCFMHAFVAQVEKVQMVRRTGLRLLLGLTR